MFFRMLFLISIFSFSSLIAFAKPSDKSLKGVKEKYRRAVREMNYTNAILLFSNVKNEAEEHGQEGKDLEELATLALARVYYEEAFSMPAENQKRLEIMKKAIETAGGKVELK